MMKRGMQTAARTINLAEPMPCARPRLVQKLVSADVVRPCPHDESVGRSYRPSRVMPVRICRRKDLERACQPKVSAYSFPCKFRIKYSDEYRALVSVII